ncbi:ABC transporter substrate-binding protein [Calderihabitans maritimus]|uniref:Branched-chain amino acid ABC transporter substrate-binding protein n=1 Tax=Calderihabitans maritimus TaxID=1246530 RepID=A0A1Z5HR62_9FIRM|nr:ABC transporter substrate-binding protein [Calderihabitans maritimus]GAW91918.1 branched-chain amino acid ABC transporter substrate-binding protein [Calderihabitans maritimus]
MQFLKRHKLVNLFFVLMLTVALVAGCTTTTQPKETSEKQTEQGTTETQKSGEAAEQVSEIKIGAIYPLSGSAAATGEDLANGVKLAVEIINGSYPDLNLPLAKDAGLPNLGGAKIKLILADHQASPEKGASEAERLITQEKVVALVGSYHSSVTATASQTAERYGIPFVNGESTSPTLTKRGFKWFFRTTPDDQIFSENFFQFLDDLKEKGLISDPKLALLYENTLWGSEVGKFEKQFAAEYGYNVVEDINYPAKSTNLNSEVQKLKAAKPDILLQASYVSDAILSMKTYKELDFNVDAILAMDAGFIAPEFLKVLNEDGEYILSREVWALDLAKNKPMIKLVNDMFKERFGTNMDGNSARAFTAMLVLADAINRAGSVEPEAIQQALLETNIPAEQLIMPWKGIKFDPETHQNVLGSGIIVQIQNGEYVTVWPWNLASKDLIWPMPKWSDR